MFWTGGLIFRKTGVCTGMVWYGVFCMHQYKQSVGTRVSNTLFCVQTVYRCMQNVPYHTFIIYNRLPEDELSGSKHLEDIKNYHINLENTRFVGYKLYYNGRCKKHEITHCCNICVVCGAHVVCAAFCTIILWNANWVSREIRAEKECDLQFLKLLEIIFKTVKHLVIWDKIMGQQLVHIVHTDTLITVSQGLIAVQGVYVHMNMTEPNFYWNLKAPDFVL